MCVDVNKNFRAPMAPRFRPTMVMVGTKVVGERGLNKAPGGMKAPSEHGKTQGN